MSSAKPARARLVEGVDPLVPVIGLVALYLAVVAVARGPALEATSAAVSVAIAFDLCVTAALLVWWLGVRQRTWPTWSVGATAAVGLAAAHLLVPDRRVVLWLSAGLVLLELALLGLAVRRVRLVLRVARQHQNAGPIGALERGLTAAALPRSVAGLLAFELAAVWFALTGWFRRRPSAGFSMDRRRGWLVVGLLLIGLALAEALVVHALLAPRSGVAAWVASGLALYGVLLLAADIQLTRLVPLRVEGGRVWVCVGLRWRGDFAIDQVVAIREARATPPGALRAGILGANLVVELSEAVEFRGPYGVRRKRNLIALTLDDPVAFRSALGLLVG